MSMNWVDSERRRQELAEQRKASEDEHIRRINEGLVRGRLPAQEGARTELIDKSVEFNNAWHAYQLTGADKVKREKTRKIVARERARKKTFY